MATKKKEAKKKATSRKRRPLPAPTVSRSRPGHAGPVNEWLELRRSAIHGLGGFARKDIPKGTRIIDYAGEKISNAVADRRYDDEKMKQHHTFLFILNKRQ